MAITVPDDLDAGVPTGAGLVANTDEELRALKAAINDAYQTMRDMLSEGLGQVPAGVIIYHPSPSILGGYIPASGRICIGKAAPATFVGTQYIGTTYQAVFNALWDSVVAAFAGDTYRPAASRSAIWMVTAAGSQTTKSANALTDWDANRCIVMDMVGLVVAAAGIPNLTELAFPTGTLTSGQYRGTETHTLTVAQMPTHDHVSGTGGIYKNIFRAPYGGSLTGNDTNGSGTEQPVGGSDAAPMAPSGGGGAHTNLQPTLYLYPHIKY